MRAFLTTLSFAALAAIGAASAASTAPPVYPDAVPGNLPKGVALKTPPPQVKAFVTSASFATVKAWYQAHLADKTEMQQPGMEKTEDAFLIGEGAHALVVMIRSFQGRTWILIGPPT